MFAFLSVASSSDSIKTQRQIFYALLFLQQSGEKYCRMTQEASLRNSGREIDMNFIVFRHSI